MPFQFTCPQGHLLEGDPAHAGMQSQCPMCGAMFIIPQPPAVAPQPDPGFPGIGPNLGIGPLGPSNAPPGGGGFNLGINLPGALAQAPAPDPEPMVAPGIVVAGPGVVSGPAAIEPAAPAQEDPDPIIHILCPNGHELETPTSMLGSDAMCPHCEVPFRLRYEDSREYREKKQKEREHREAAFGRKALHYAIVAAVVVILSLIGLMVFYR
jgi:hypothetical protein